MIDTREHGTDKTGLTIIGEDGTGVFIADTPTYMPKVSAEERLLDPFVEEEANQSLEALYPHWEGSQAGAGMAVHVVSRAIDELESASQLGNENSPEYLALILRAETDLFSALRHATFNKAFSMVLSFSCWAVRNTLPKKENAPSLPGLISALREIVNSPFLALARASVVVEALEHQGWSDESNISEAFEAGMVKGGAAQESASQ